MSPNTHRPALAVLCALLVIGVAGPASGVAGAAPLDGTLIDDGNESTTATDDESGDDLDLLDDADDATPAVDESLSVGADVSAEADESLDAAVAASANDTGTTVIVTASSGDTLSVDARVDATGGSVTLAADATLNASVADRPAAVDAEHSTDDHPEPDSDEPERSPGTGANGSDADAPSDEPTSPLPDRAPVAAVGVAVVGGAAAARKGVAALGLGPSPPGVRASAHAAVDRLRSDLPRPVLPFGYSRHDDSDPLEHGVRAEIYDVVRSVPGVHLSALHARSDVSLSSVRHHARVLEDEDLVESERIRGKRRFFPAGSDNPTLAAALAEPATESVLRTLAEAEPATVSELATSLDLDPSTVSHHLERLDEDGLVERERDGRAVRTSLVPTTRRVLDAADGQPVGASMD